MSSFRSSGARPGRCAEIADADARLAHGARLRGRPRGRARRDEPQTLEAVTRNWSHYLQGMFIWGHPRAQINVVPNPTIASMIGVLLPLAYNPNLCSDESGRLLLRGRGRGPWR